MSQSQLQNCYVRLKNGQLVLRSLMVQYQNQEPILAHDSTGLYQLFYDFALTYEEMIAKFTTGPQKKRLQIIQDDYLAFIQQPTQHTKIYLRDFLNKNDNWLECTWNGSLFTCGRHLYFEIDDLLNLPIYFAPPLNTPVQTEWTNNGYIWSDQLKSWVKEKKNNPKKEISAKHLK